MSVYTEHRSFDTLLYESVRRTPWWLASVALHALLVFALTTFDFGTARTELSVALTSRVIEDVLPPPEEEIKPPIEDFKPMEVTEEPIEDPEIDDVAESVEEVVDEPAADPGRPEFEGESAFEGPSTNNVMGIGGGAGGDHGGPYSGRRRMRGVGDGRQVDNATDLGLEWLKNHQDDEGMWDCDGFMKHDRVPPVCDGAGNAMYDPGVSGLALLAFLGAGETHKHGRYKATVSRGLKYVKQIQDPEGCFGPRTTNHFTYNHAIGALAMAEAYGLTGSPLFRQSAQNAIDFIHKCQNPYLAWRYGVRPGENDTSVTGWMVMALKSAKVCNLRVDENAFAGARAWLDKVTEPEYGRVGYTSRGTGPARPQDVMDKWPADKSESLTAVGVLSRIFMGEDPRKSETIQKGTALCLKALPVWDEASGAIDMYYWYYGSLAMFQVGGPPWKAWNEAMKTAIIDHQRKDHISFKGSWDPVDPWGRDGGRVYSTALMVMCMEVYYRYPQVFGTR